MPKKKPQYPNKLRILLVTPPMTQLNTPYPACSYLAGYLKEHHAERFEVVQKDLSIELFHKIFCKDGLVQIFDELEQKRNSKTSLYEEFFSKRDRYIATIDYAINFLTSAESSMAYRVSNRGFLPEGPRFANLNLLEEQGESDPLSMSFGPLSIVDKAKHIASLYIDDIADAINAFIDGNFMLSKYAESLSASVTSFDPILKNLKKKKLTMVERYLDELVVKHIHEIEPNLIACTVPFPGNVYGAFRCAQTAKKVDASIQCVLGGGYVNTELRELNESRVFDYFDFVTLDDGYSPFLSILNFIDKEADDETLFRCFIRRDDKVVFKNTTRLHDVPFRDAGTPNYAGLDMTRYVSMLEMLNPMHRLWSDGRWNKLTLAHGCYWRACAFCDVSLDYISRYEEQGVGLIVNKMENIIQQTGARGFHFVDEAAPPKTLFGLAAKLIEQRVAVSWWANIRFEKSFTKDRAQLLADAGCIAMSGGLEVASDRLLKLMNKGVSVEQVAKVTHALSEAGIMVHAYLMYGFPTQTLQESIDALDRVRQLFLTGCIQSAYWHRFSATVHSPVGKNPEKFSISVAVPPKNAFAKNDIEHFDKQSANHDRIGAGLNKALYNYMHGVGLEEDVRFWFDFDVPKTKVPHNLIEGYLS